MGAKTQFSAQQAADGMAELAAKGLSTTDILTTMPGIFDLAAAGQLSIARASEIATDTLKQFGLDVSESSRVADVLAKAAIPARQAWMIWAGRWVLSVRRRRRQA